MWNPHFLEVASNIQVDTPMMSSAENAGMTDSSYLMDLSNEIAALTQELKDSETNFAKLKCEYTVLNMMHMVSYVCRFHFDVNFKLITHFSVRTRRF